MDSVQSGTDRPVHQERLLEGRVALVTGASRGIGAATAGLLARNGGTDSNGTKNNDLHKP